MTAANILSDFEAEYGAQLIGCTIARVRIAGAVFSTFPAGTFASPAVGLLKAAQQEVVTTSNPTVGVGKHVDWMYFRGVPLNGGFATAPADNINFLRFEDDVKSMRKLDELGESLHLVIGQDPAEGAGEVSWFFWTSTLIMLP